MRHPARITVCLLGLSLLLLLAGGRGRAMPAEPGPGDAGRSDAPADGLAGRARQLAKGARLAGPLADPTMQLREGRPIAEAPQRARAEAWLGQAATGARPPGRLRDPGAVLATLAGEAPGLRLHAPEAISCPLEPLAAGGPVAGSLEPSDCRLPQLITIQSEDPTDAPTDAYRLDLTERSRLTLQLGAADFDPLLILLGPGGDLLAAQVEGQDPGLPQADLELVLPAGTYFVLVTEQVLDPNAAGAYTLQAEAMAEPVAGPCAAPALAPTGTTTGSLEPSDCRYFDLLPGLGLQSFADRHRLRLEEAGTISLALSSEAFAPALVLAAEGRTIASTLDSDGGATPASLELALPAGDYEVLALAEVALGAIDSTLGVYALNASFVAAPADACRPQPAPPGQTLAGDLATGDCRVAWLELGTYDQSWVDLYQVIVPQFLDGWDITLAAQGFRPALRFLDLSLDPWLQGVENPDGDRLDLRVESVAAATYLLAVESAGSEAAGGSYDLEHTLQPVSSLDCSVATIAAGQSLAGELSESDCYLTDSYGQIYSGEIVSDIDARLDQYRVTVTERGRLTARASSAAVDMALVLETAAVSGAPVVAEDPAAMGAEGSAVVVPGTYLVLVSSMTPDLGAYQLELDFLPQAAGDCGPVALGFDTAIAGALEAGDCLFGDVFAGDFLQRYADVYQVSLPQRGRLTVELASDDFDAYLELYPAEEDVLIDFGNDLVDWVVLDAGIEQVLPAGDYRIVASSEPGMDLGAYRIDASFAPEAADCSVAALGLDELVEGELVESGCRTTDLPGGGYIGVPTDLYRLTVPQRGVLSIEMNSEDALDGVDPVLFFYTHDWRLVGSNDDLLQETILDAFLALDLGPGVYHLVAATSTGLVGDYQLVTSFEPADYAFEPATPVPTTPSPVTPTATPRPPGDGIYLPVLRRG